MNSDIVVDPRRWWALVVVLIATLMSLIDSSIVNVAVPSIQAELHTDTAQVQFVVVGYILAYAVGLVTGSRLGDMFGRKRMYQLGMIVFLLASLACGFAPTPSLLIFSRVIQGLGAALMVPQVISIIQVTFPPAEKPLAFSIYGVALGVGGAVGQVLGGVLIINNFLGLGWRNAFFVNIPIGIIALIMSIFLVRESRVEGVRKLDLVGIVLLAASLVLLVYPLSVGREAGWPLWSFISLILSIPCFIIFGLYENWLIKHNGSPLLALSLFRNRRFTIGLITVLSYYATPTAFYFVLSIFVQQGHGFTPLQSSLTVLPLALSFVLTSFFTPRLMARYGLKPLYFGIVLIVIGTTALILAIPGLGTGLHNPLQLAAELIVIGLGEGFIAAPIVSLTVSNVPVEHVGSASGSVTTINQVAQAVGIALIGIVFFSVLGTLVPDSSASQVSLHYNQAFVFSLIELIGLTLINLVALVLLDHTPKEQPVTVPQKSNVKAAIED